MQRSPHALAQLTLRAHWDGALPVDPARIARALRIHLGELAPAGEDPACVHLSIREGRHVLCVEPRLEHTRRRFAIAHALGHILLGHVGKAAALIDTPASYSSGQTDPRELLANQFSAELLMPEAAVRRLFLSGRAGSVQALSQAFEVSAAAMAFRIRALRLV